MSKTIQEIVKEIESDFSLLWGLAPDDSLKGRKGKEIKNFISSSLTKALIEVLEGIVDEDEPLDDDYSEEEKQLATKIYGSDKTPEYLKERRHGRNLQRQEVRENIKKIKGEI